MCTATHRAGRRGGRIVPAKPRNGACIFILKEGPVSVLTPGWTNVRKDDPYMMKQAYIERVGSLRFREQARPEPGPGELLIRIHTALTCGTDLKMLRRGHAVLAIPGPAGHEAAGVVAATGEGVSGFSVGDEVMWAPTAPCRGCGPCERGAFNHCETLFSTMAMGAYANYILLPKRIVEQHVFHKPARLPFAEAALMEPLACILRGWRRLGAFRDQGEEKGPDRGGIDSVLIIGVGAIGLLHVAVAKALGVSQITAVGGRPSGLELASTLGADDAVQGHVPAVSQTLKERGLADADVVIECTGRADVWAEAPGLTRIGGKTMLFGGLTGGTVVPFDAQRIHYDEVTLLGSFHYKPADVQEAYRLLAGGALQLGGLITGERPLSELPDAFDELERGEAVKFALRTGEGE